MKDAFKYLLRLEWLHFERSADLDKNILTKILYFFPKVVLVSYFVLVGLFLDRFINGIFPNDNPLVIWGMYLPFLYVTIFITKFFVKKDEDNDVLPYLLMPINRDSLFRVAFIMEAFSLWNFFEFAFSLLFLINVGQNMFKIVAVLVFLYELGLSSTLVSRRLKRLSNFDALFVVIAVVLIVALIGGWYYFIQMPCSKTLMYGLLKMSAIVWIIVDVLLFYCIHKIYLMSSKTEVYLLFDDPYESVILNKIFRRK